MFLPSKYQHLEKWLENMKHLAKGSLGVGGASNCLGLVYNDMVAMGLPEKDRKQLISDLLKDIQTDIDEQIIKDIEKAAGVSAGNFKKAMGQGHSVNPLGKEIELTHDFPLYIGVSGRGHVMSVVNTAYEEQKDHTLDQFLQAIDGWIMNMPHEKRFSLKVNMPTGIQRAFDCILVEVMVRSIGELIGGTKKTPFQVRMRIKTAIPDYLEQINQLGHFYLTGFVDVDDASKGGGMLFTVKGLGFVVERYDSTNMTPIYSEHQLLLGEDV